VSSITKNTNGATGAMKLSNGTKMNISINAIIEIRLNNDITVKVTGLISAYDLHAIPINNSGEIGIKGVNSKNTAIKINSITEEKVGLINSLIIFKFNSIAAA
jgi:hypothetical protein